MENQTRKTDPKDSENGLKMEVTGRGATYILHLACQLPSCLIDENNNRKKKKKKVTGSFRNLHLSYLKREFNRAESGGQTLLNRAEHVSPVSSVPVWFPQTNVTAVPPGYRADNSLFASVCLRVCMRVCVSHRRGEVADDGGERAEV